MIIFISGTDRDKVRAHANKAVDTLCTKRPNAGFFKMDDESFDEVAFEELVFSQGLFDRKCISYLHDVMKTKEVEEYLLKKIPEMAESENAFVIAEEAVGKKTKNALEKHALKNEVFDMVKAKKTEFNIFGLGDAVGARNKKQLWTVLIQAYRSGITPEQAHGTILNQVKNMAMVQKAGEENVSDGKLGLHPFVVKKTKQVLRNYSKEELLKQQRKLVHIYHEARQGKEELDIALEKWVLKL